MNREIKFRGMRKTPGKEWIYGDLVRNVQGDFAVIPPYKMNMKNTCSDYEVIPETIGQFTRLRDIESKEIYDGDIITVRDIYQKEDYVGCIRGESSTYDYGVYFINHPLKNLWTLNDAFFYYGGNVKVIGNIFDNPELMEK